MTSSLPICTKINPISALRLLSSIHITAQLARHSNYGPPYFFRLALLTLILCAPILVIGQSQLSITVIDAQTEEPLAFANIFIAECQCGGVTDGSGVLRQDLSENDYTIVTSSIGYLSDTLSLHIRIDTAIRIPLRSADYVLEGVEVTAINLDENVSRTEMGVQQITARDLKLLPTVIGEKDIFRSVAMLSGIGSAGEASNGISVRGGSLDQNLVLYDYAPIYNPTHLFGLFSVFTPDVTSSVNIYKANMPANYGGKIASVVDVRVKNPSAEELQLTGGISLISAKMAIEAPIIKDKLHLLAAGRYAPTDFFFSAIKRLKNTQAKFYDGTLKFSYKPTKKDVIQWTGFVSEDFYEVDIISKIGDISASSNQFDYHMINGTLNWLHSFSTRSNFRTTLVRSHYRPQNLFPEEQSDNIITYESQINNVSLDLSYEYRESSQQSFSIGSQLEKTVLSPGGLHPGSSNNINEQVLANENGYTLAAYADYQYQHSPNLALQFGLRYAHYLLAGPFDQAIYDHDDKKNLISTQSFGAGEIAQSYQGLEPRLGLRLKLGDQQSIKASYARSKQYLQNIFNSTTPLPTSRWKFSDPYLEPQSSDLFSVGLYWNSLKKQMEFSVEGYYRTTENVLEYKPGAEFFLVKHLEQDVIQGQGRSYGIEFSVTQRTAKFNGWLNYTWSRSWRRATDPDPRSNINEGKWFPSDFDRPHVLNGTFSFHADEFNSFGINVTAQSGRPYSVANSVFEFVGVDVPIFLERNNARLPIYHRIDFSWKIHNITTKREKRWKGDWIFTIYNILGRKNALNRYYGPKESGGNNLFAGPLAAYQLSIFGTQIVSLGYTFQFRNT